MSIDATTIPPDWFEFLDELNTLVEETEIYREEILELMLSYIGLPEE